ncbi:Hypothetical_protein [Hexamita inflata]|uniref:Hypothetical_protein n=1 Tax=Hexamita inflata TaxID=28002 RepID=A0AA86Q1J2_9EUKA|nr:Hypothetical protein HINF_LOCUS37776 [Hexamita inflata]
MLICIFLTQHTQLTLNYISHSKLIQKQNVFAAPNKHTFSYIKQIQRNDFGGQIKEQTPRFVKYINNAESYQHVLDATNNQIKTYSPSRNAAVAQFLNIGKITHRVLTATELQYLNSKYMLSDNKANFLAENYQNTKFTVEQFTWLVAREPEHVKLKCSIQCKNNIIDIHTQLDKFLKIFETKLSQNKFKQQLGSFK